MKGRTRQVEDALGDAGVNWSHTGDGPDETVVWYDQDRDDPDLIVQVVERETEYEYEGEEKYPHDDVRGLRFSG